MRLRALAVLATFVSGCVLHPTVSSIALRPAIRDPDVFGMIIHDPMRADTAVFDLAVDPRAAGGVRYRHNPELADDAVLARGWLGDPGLELIVTNRAAEPLDFNYLLDQYLVRLRDGQRVWLSPGDPGRYPQRLKPGASYAMTLGTPPGLRLQEMLYVAGKVNHDQTLLVLYPFVSRADIEAMAAPKPTGFQGVVVEFQRGPGTTGSSLEVWWDDQPRATDRGGTILAAEEVSRAAERATLRGGDRQLFELPPGRHVMRFLARITWGRDIAGAVPVIVHPTSPAITIRARTRNRLVRYDLDLNVWQGDNLVTDTWFRPPQRRWRPLWRIAPGDTTNG